MKLSELTDANKFAFDQHMIGALAISGANQILFLIADSKDEMRDELHRELFEVYGEDFYNPKTHRVVAIMAADREPGDAAKAVEDVVMGNADAARVFDAVGEAFAIRADGNHVSLDIHIDNDRVSIESWAPPRNAEVPLDAFKGLAQGLTDATREAFAIAQPGEKISATTATDITPRPLAAFALEDQVMIKYGDELAGPAKIMGITHYLDAETQYLASYITKSGDPQSIWSAEGGLRALADFRGVNGTPSVAPADQSE